MRLLGPHSHSRCTITGHRYLFPHLLCRVHFLETPAKVQTIKYSSVLHTALCLLPSARTGTTAGLHVCELTMIV